MLFLFLRRALEFLHVSVAKVSVGVDLCTSGFVRIYASPGNPRRKFTTARRMLQNLRRPKRHKFVRSPLQKVARKLAENTPSFKKRRSQGNQKQYQKKAKTNRAAAQSTGCHRHSRGSRILPSVAFGAQGAHKCVWHRDPSGFAL